MSNMYGSRILGGRNIAGTRISFLTVGRNPSSIPSTKHILDYKSRSIMGKNIIRGDHVVSQPIKRTNYCDLLAQGMSIDGDSAYAVEKIFVNENKREEIRFAWYKIKDDKHVFQARPLDLPEEQLLQLLKDGFESEVFSHEFRKKLKEIL